MRRSSDFLCADSSTCSGQGPEPQGVNAGGFGLPPQVVKRSRRGKPTEPHPSSRRGVAAEVRGEVGSGRPMDPGRREPSLLRLRHQLPGRHQVLGHHGRGGHAGDPVGRGRRLADHDRPHREALRHPAGLARRRHRLWLKREPRLAGQEARDHPVHPGDRQDRADRRNMVAGGVRMGRGERPVHLPGRPCPAAVPAQLLGPQPREEHHRHAQVPRPPGHLPGLPVEGSLLPDKDVPLTLPKSCDRRP